MKKFSLCFFAILISFNFSCAAETVPNNWVKNETRFFSLMLPPEMKPVPMRGEDSYVGAYENSKSRLEFDYGPYSQDISNSSNLDFKYTQMEIDHLPAKIFTYFDHGKYIAAVHFPMTGAGLFKNGDKLTITITYSQPPAADDYMLIFQSIHFNKTKP